MTAHVTRFLLASSLVVVGACTDIDSSDVTTGGMWAQVTVEDDAQASTSIVTAVLKVGGGASDTYVELDGDDVLMVAFEDQSVQLRKQSFFDAHHYEVTFDTSPADTDYVVSLERTVDDGAPDTRVQLPKSFELDPIDDLNRSTDDLVVSWTNPSPDPMALRVAGDCIEDFDQGIDGDTGSFTLPAGGLSTRPDASDTSCDLTVTLTRARSGDLDPAYGEGGEAMGRRVRSQTVPSIR